MKRKVSIVLLCVLMHSTALAFEVNGVRSGMVYHEVVTKLKQQGFEVIPQEIFPVSLLAKRGEDSDLLQFCDGKLTLYSYNLLGDISSYIRVVHQMTNQRGAGQYQVISSESTHGPSNALHFTWVEGPDVIKVIYTAKSVQARESITVMQHVAKTKCQK